MALVPNYNENRRAQCQKTARKIDCRLPEKMIVAADFLHDRPVGSVERVVLLLQGGEFGVPLADSSLLVDHDSFQFVQKTHCLK